MGESKPNNTKNRTKEVIYWVLENMKNSATDICSVIETRMNQIIVKINEADSIFESDPLDSELRILDYLFYHVCKDQQKRLATGL